jgi:hypothetical protein
MARKDEAYAQVGVLQFLVGIRKYLLQLSLQYELGGELSTVKREQFCSIHEIFFFDGVTGA